jgi:hypothetical protein
MMLEQLSILDLPPSVNPPTELFKHQREGASSLCNQCGTEYVKKRPTQTYCCFKCKKKAKKKRYIKKHGQKWSYDLCVCGNKKSKTSKHCQGCSRRPKREKHKHELINLPCRMCGVVFMQKTKSHSCCSDACRQRSKRKARPEHYRALIGGHARDAIKRDPAKRIARSVRVRIREGLICGMVTKTKKTFDILGYTPSQLKTHLERQFIFGMSWSNYGTEWHIDHIKPVSHHVIKTMKDAARCWSLKNLKPRYATNRCAAKYGAFETGNIEKGNRYVG